MAKVSRPVSQKVQVYMSASEYHAFTQERPCMVSESKFAKSLIMGKIRDLQANKRKGGR